MLPLFVGMIRIKGETLQSKPVNSTERDNIFENGHQLKKSHAMTSAHRSQWRRYAAQDNRNINTCYPRWTGEISKRTWYEGHTIGLGETIRFVIHIIFEGWHIEDITEKHCVKMRRPREYCSTLQRGEFPSVSSGFTHIHPLQLNLSVSVRRHRSQSKERVNEQG